MVATKYDAVDPHLSARGTDAGPRAQPNPNSSSAVVSPEQGRYRKKPVVITAHRLGEDGWPDAIWQGVNDCKITLHLGRDGNKRVVGHADIHTLEGTMRAEIGDWIICGTKGEFYPCKPDIFAQIYEPATLPPPPDQGRTERCNQGFVCEKHPDREWPHDDCAGPGMLCRPLQVRETYWLEFVANLRAAHIKQLATLPPPSSWQPIETAPKDGTTVIGYDLSRTYEPEEGLGAIEFMRWIDGAWRDPETHTMRASHWQPLPAPPALVSPQETAGHE